MKLSGVGALAMVAGFASQALAVPPQFVLTGQLGSGITADGQSVVGSNFDLAAGVYYIKVFTPGVGTLNTYAVRDNDALAISNDGGVIAYGAYDLENVAGLGTDILTPHSWTDANGAVNHGLAPFSFNCDAFAASMNGLSGNGRYMVGGTYTQQLCGPYRPFRFDRQTNSWEIITPRPGSRSANAWSASNDGSVVCGRDEADPNDVQVTRVAAVWIKNGATWNQTILDPRGGEAVAVSGDGNTVIGTMHEETFYEVFGVFDTCPVRWTRSGNTWTPHMLGGNFTLTPAACSFDGSTIVGNGGDDGSGFIWRADLNGGVPMGMMDYTIANNGNLPEDFVIGSYFGAPIIDISDDGNAVLVSLWSNRNPCLPWFPSAIMYLNGAPCTAAEFTSTPVSHYNPAGPASEPFGMTFNCFITGSMDLNIQWQKESEPGSGQWDNLVDDNCDEFLPEYFNYRGTNTMQLRLGSLDNVWPGRYRCVIINDCGTQTSNPFRVSTCLADLTCDQVVDLSDYFQFFNAFDQGTSEADLTDNGEVDLEDFFAFFNAFDQGC